MLIFSGFRWSYNGLLIDSVHPRMRQVQQFEGSLGTRSELLITNTSVAENGSFLCSAENKAGKSMANYSVQVESYKSDTLVMEMKMEHFIAVSVCVIVILILLMVIVTILLIKIARKHLDSDKDTKSSNTSVYKASSMPRSIQMGTGHVVKRAAPDLLSGVSQSQSSSDGSMVSMETVLTPANSDLSDMRDIIKDLGDHTQPLIGQTPLANQSQVSQQPSWSVDNPYLHTSGPPPYLVYRQRLAVRPDEQYPILSYQYCHQSPSPGHPYYTLHSNNYSVPHNIAPETTLSPNNSQLKSLKPEPSSISSNPVKSQINNVINDNSHVISDNDTVAEMLNKLQGKANKDEEDSVEISEELENAFPSLNLSTQCWDPSEGTRI